MKKKLCVKSLLLWLHILWFSLCQSHSGVVKCDSWFWAEPQQCVVFRGCAREGEEAAALPTPPLITWADCGADRKAGRRPRSPSIRASLKMVGWECSGNQRGLPGTGAWFWALVPENHWDFFLNFSIFVLKKNTDTVKERSQEQDFSFYEDFRAGLNFGVSEMPRLEVLVQHLWKCLADCTAVVTLPLLRLPQGHLRQQGPRGLQGARAGYALTPAHWGSRVAN